MKYNLYNLEHVGSFVAYVLDVNGDDDWQDNSWKLPRQTPKEVATLACKMTCSNRYRGANSKKTAYRRLIRLAKEHCPDLLDAAIEESRKNLIDE